MAKLRVGVVFGGRSGEHEVSLMSAASIMEAIDKERYEVVPIGIARTGQWLAGGDALQALLQGQPDLSAPVVPLPLPGHGGAVRRLEAAHISAEPTAHAAVGSAIDIDIFFPVLHGPYGEDGTIQGLFDMADVPYVGCGVGASAVGMDKAFMKALFEQAGLPVVPYVVFTDAQWIAGPDAIRARIADKLGFPCFVKPVNLGSSVGISHVNDAGALDSAIEEALRHDRKVIVEQAALDCREVEVSVLGNDDPQPSVAGEIAPPGDFYDYDAKYHDDRSELIIPARISEETAAEVRRLAVEAFRTIDGAGLARVDFFVHKDTEAIWVNEINTMPGFTRISMYPKLWEATGLAYPELIDRLLQLGMERHAVRRTPGRAPERDRQA